MGKRGDRYMDKIKYFIIHYKLHFSAAAAVLFYIIYKIKRSKYIYPADLFSEASNIMLLLLLVAIWLFITVYFFMQTFYSDQTGGRNYMMDRIHYHRSYYDLIRYFKDADPYLITFPNANEGSIYKYNKKTIAYRQSWKDVEGIILGRKNGQIIRRSGLDNKDGGNLALFALPGSGKTTSQIIPSALQFGGSVLAIDIKGDIYRVANLKRNIRVFAPDDPENSCRYNPLSGIDKLSITERRSFVEQMAAVLVPEEKDGKYFTDGARDFFCGISLYLMREDIRITLPEISRHILQGNAFDWVIRIKESDCIEAQEFTNSYFGSNEKNVAGAYGGIAKSVRPFATGELSNLLSDDGSCISPDDLMNGRDIYIIIPQDKIKLYAPITTILVQNFMTAFMKRTDNSSGEAIQPVLFLLDEFAQLHFDPGVISAAFSTLRSKRVSIFIAMQSLAQLEKNYGELGCREIIDCCSYLSCMGVQDYKSREFFQKLIGSRKVLRISTNENGDSQDGTSTIEAREPIFQPELLGNLEDRVLIYAQGKYTFAEKTPFYDV